MTHTKTTPAAENQCVSIGYTRDDGDFRILATLNNHDEELLPDKFALIVKNLANCYARSHELGQGKPKLEIQILEREDAPDYVTLD